MKKVLLCFALILGFPVLLSAQFSGGNGRGDATLECLNILTNSGNNTNAIPASTSLEQNYPNPFSKETIIKFKVANPGEVKIVVYNITGREVQTLLNESLEPGIHAVSFDGSSEKSGVYFYKIISGDYSETRRMILKK